MALKPNRPSRQTIDYKTVGSPTNDGVRWLNEESLLSYQTALERQIATEVKPNEQHKEALNKAKEKLDQEISFREFWYK